MARKSAAPESPIALVADPGAQVEAHGRGHPAQQCLAHVTVGHDAEQAIVGVGDECDLVAVRGDGLKRQPNACAGRHAEIRGNDSPCRPNA